MSQVQHIAGRTFHGRNGPGPSGNDAAERPQNRFAYGVDYLLIDAEADQSAPALFSRNRRNLLSIHDSDHGGERGAGTGARWVRDVLAKAGAPAVAKVELLAQPRVLGHVFNPVSFWLCRDTSGALVCVIAEVNNTFGDRHSYLCRHDDWAPIGPTDTITARKIFHVSPFQPVDGAYEFRFDLRDDAIAIRIAYGHDKGGLVATLTGPLRPATNRGLMAAMLRRPLGSRRVLALIHWQALKLWWKGATYRPRPLPPSHEVSR